MIRVLHLFDASAGWEHRLAVQSLLDRLPADRIESQLGTIDPAARTQVARPDQRLVLFRRRFHADFLYVAPRLRRHLDAHGIDIVHAWGLHAAKVAEAAASASARPVLLTRFNPTLTPREAAFLRSLPPTDRRPVLCASQTVRRRLLETGLPPDRCIVIRPGADGDRIRRARTSGLRARLGLTPENTLVVTPEPVTRHAGHFAAFWMTAIRSFLDPGFRVALPGASREKDRLLRLARQLDMTRIVVDTDETVAYPDLVAVADLAVVVPTGEVSVGAIAWAMAAGLPVIGTAVQCVNELIADNRNGRLVAPAPAKRLATHLARLAGEPETLRRLAEAARKDADERFRVSRYADQVRRLYENLTQGRLAADGISDPAS
ncbi:MAG: glycosyltransferase family 4 protein [Phycisphaerae bacterium]|nr:glycosyltransferase family 4 protein [Phycisphaerae bacterium]